MTLHDSKPLPPILEESINNFVSVGKQFPTNPPSGSPSQDESISQVLGVSDVPMTYSGPVEVLLLPPIAATAVSLPRRSSRAHAPAEAMLNLQRVVPEGTYTLQTPVAVVTLAASVVDDAAPATKTAEVASEAPGPAAPAQNVDSDIEMPGSPGSPALDAPLPHPESPSSDVEMGPPAPCPFTLLLSKWEETFAALAAEIACNHSGAMAVDGLGPRVADLRQLMMRSASMLIPTRSAKPQHRPDLFTGAPTKANASATASTAKVAAAPFPATFAAAAATASIPQGSKRMRSSKPIREFAPEELARCVPRPAPSAAAAFRRTHPNWRVVHVKGFVPPKNTPVVALIALLAQHGLPAKTRTMCNISYMGFGMTEVVIEAGHFDAFTAAAIAAGLQVSTTFNARLPCLRETAESAFARFRARVNASIARLEAKPPSAYFDDLIAFLKAYRDGDSNCPTFAPAARAPTQLETAFAPASNSSPVMGEEY
jgi:hypothetical protein